MAQDASIPSGWHIGRRGEDFAVHQKVNVRIDPDGTFHFLTNRFTVLENGMHYFEDGQWKESRDVIESFPQGAVAQYGPNKAIFSPDLNSESVFDVQTSDGKRLRGGVRSMQLTDLATGQSAVLASLKQSTPGELLLPNQIVYRDGFEGLAADVLFTWKHSLFAQDVILRERPLLPAGMNPDTTQFEVITEFVDAPQPEIRPQTVRRDGRPPLTDHTVIHFGKMAMIMGKAFRLAGENAVVLGGLNPVDGAIPVLKQWQVLENGRTFLVESIAWSDLAPQLEGLPDRRRAEADGDPSRETAQARIWPDAVPPLDIRAPIQLAATPYEADGFVIDYTTVPDETSPTTFATGETYYIPTNYYTGSTITFEPGCVIKYKEDAYLLMFGSISFPDTLQTPVFTSKDDNSFGEPICESNCNPANNMAAQAIWIYYVDFNTTIQSARIRWAKRGIQYDQNIGETAEHTVSNCLFEEFPSGTTGIYINIPSGDGVTISDTEKCGVTTPVTVSSGSYSGSMSSAAFCAQTSFAGINGGAEDADGIAVADTMGAIGPDEFVEVLNGKMAIFDSSDGSRTGEELLDDFFQISTEDRDMADPRVVYDHFNQRWVAAAVDRNSDRIVLAVTDSGSPATNNWTKYELEVERTNATTDFPTLGIDTNGIYLSVWHFKANEVDDGNTIVAVKAPEIYEGSFYPTMLHQTNVVTRAIQPAMNFDNSPQGDYAWLITKAPSTGTGGSYAGGSIKYRQLGWNGTNAVWASGWQELTEPSPTYRDYFDLDDAQKYAPQSGETSSIDLQETERSRLQMAMIRDGYLWTCQTVGLDGTDGDYDGTESGSTLDRSAIQWLKMEISGTGTNLYLTNTVHDRIFDSVSSSGAYYYFVPSLMVNADGDMVVGFSRSRSTERIGAFFSGRLSNGTTPDRPTLIQAGRDFCNPGGTDRWGDYSYTTLDPDDGRFWTVQEYAELQEDSNSIWGTWILSIQVP